MDIKLQRHQPKRVVAVCLAVLVVSGAPPRAATAATEAFIWVEGEDAKTSTAWRHGWYDSVKKGELSGGQWLSHFHKGGEALATYEINVPAAGEYTFWVRANPIARPKLSYRFGSAAWRPIDMSGKVDTINIAADGAPDMRFIGWIKVGKVRLARGRATLAFKMHSENQNHGGLDCFVLTRGVFVPNGQLKPGQKLGRAGEGTWAFEPDPDRFDHKAMLDLSDLNDKPAGRSGFIRRTADRNDFADGAGRAIRFWAINTYVQRKGGMEALGRHAKWLAKRGVNMVRFHGHLAPGSGSKVTDVNEGQIDQCWRLVAAMKKEGIYTTISPYWGSHTKHESSWTTVKKGNGENLTALLFWDENLQEAYKSWLRALYGRKNPHTGIPLARDPAVAIIQLQNEDSMLFWTMQSNKGEQRRVLGRKFGRWLARKYGSISAARKAWGAGYDVKGDDWSGGVLALPILWHFTLAPKPGGLGRRMADQLHFYSETMYNFNKMIAAFLRKEFGCKQLVNAGNWRTADQVRLLDCERWSYTANEVIGNNRYYTGGAHVNPSANHKAGYLISKGDYFQSHSALRDPRALPVNYKQVVGHPHIISESEWVPPLRYQSEGPFLVAAYCSLTGVDTLYWFSTGDVEFSRPMGKWQVATPAQAGMFPAAALMFRKGYIKKAPAVVHEQRSLQNLWQRRDPAIAEDPGYDPNRDSGNIASQSNIKKGVDPLAFLVGPVEVVYGGDPARSRVIDLTRYIDRAGKKVKSVTGELSLDYGMGLCRLDAPSAQGAAGWLGKAGPIRLSTVEIRSANEYATVLVVSMDGKSLRLSGKVLVQVGTVCRPYGWKTRPASFRGRGGKGAFDGRQIVDLGGSPWNVDNTDVTVIVKNPKVTRATLLDPNGYPVRTVTMTRTAGSCTVKLPPETMYVVLH